MGRIGLMTKNKVVRDEKGRIISGACNPTGKGGFAERPQDIGYRWTKRQSIKLNEQMFLGMTDEEISRWIDEHQPLSQAEQIALQKVQKAKHDSDIGFKTYIDVANRTEGMPRQQIDQTIETYQPPQITVEFK